MSQNGYRLLLLLVVGCCLLVWLVAVGGCCGCCGCFRDEFVYVHLLRLIGKGRLTRVLKKSGLNSMKSSWKNGVNTAEISLHPRLQTAVRAARGKNVQFSKCELRRESTSGSESTFHVGKSLKFVDKLPWTVAAHRSRWLPDTRNSKD